MVDYVIPGNDDAVRAVKLITGVMANAIVEANGGKIVDYTRDEQKSDNAKEIMQKAVDSVKRKEDRPYRQNDRRDNRNNKFVKKERFEKKENKSMKTRYNDSTYVFCRRRQDPNNSFR